MSVVVHPGKTTATSTSQSVPLSLQNLHVDQLTKAILAGNRAMLARAITLIESINPDHESKAQALLQHMIPHAGKAIRLGITGPPGVGKSTFLETLGCQLTQAGKYIAVLAIDPSSKRTKGSILGDKTRMNRLAQQEHAFIRPSPSGGRLGGVASATRETMLLCEAAGFDIIFVETVGAGQNETQVAEMVDCFMVLALPGAGDELQGIKKGVLEQADFIVVNKADGANAKLAMNTACDCKNALRFLTPLEACWKPRVLLCSSLKQTGIQELWQQVLEHRQVMEAAGALQTRRAQQQIRWMWNLLEARLARQVQTKLANNKTLGSIEKAVANGQCSPSHAAEKLWRLCGLPGA